MKQVLQASHPWLLTLGRDHLRRDNLTREEIICEKCSMNIKHGKGRLHSTGGHTGSQKKTDLPKVTWGFAGRGRMGPGFLVAHKGLSSALLGIVR